MIGDERNFCYRMVPLRGWRLEMPAPLTKIMIFNTNSYVCGPTIDEILHREEPHAVRLTQQACSRLI
jgi:hypothetical protein